MLGKEITALWDDDVLSELMARLQRDGELRQYNYPGYRCSTGTRFANLAARPLYVCG